MFTLRFGVIGTAGEKLHPPVRFAKYSNTLRFRTAILSPLNQNQRQTDESDAVAVAVHSRPQLRPQWTPPRENEEKQAKSSPDSRPNDLEQLMKIDSMAVPLFERKNYSIEFAETNSRWCLAALCNAGDAIGLRRLHDRARHQKVSIGKKTNMNARENDGSNLYQRRRR